MMYVTVFIMSFNSNCRILAMELNYRFTDLPNFVHQRQYIGAAVHTLELRMSSKIK